MAANLGEDKGEDQDEQEEQFHCADLMACSLGIAGDEPGDEEVDSTHLVASGMGSSSNDDANQDSGMNYLIKKF